MKEDTGKALSAEERLDWLRLSRTENVGPVTFFQLLERFGSPSEAIKAIPDLAKRGGRKKPLKLCSVGEAEREAEAVRSIGAQIIAACEPDYPAPLRHTSDAPPVISVLGHPHLFEKSAIGVVGARNASINGQRIAENISRDLGNAGHLISSGLARGIDTAAHKGSLSTGTAAVLAGGIDVVYPPQNQDLYDQIKEQGVIIAESPFGSQPVARHFPRRNRIISGMSLGVLVVEAAIKSGSLITARLAGDQGREVFAVPGSPLDPRAQGPNDLIKNGATLVEKAKDILDALCHMNRPIFKESQYSLFAAAPMQNMMEGTPIEAEMDEKTLEEALKVIVSGLSPTPIAVDELVRRCDLSAAIVNTAILDLELAGRVERHPGGRVSLLME